MIYSSAESTPFLSPIGLNERTFQAHRNGSKMRAQSRTHLAELFVSQKEMKASTQASIGQIPVVICCLGLLLTPLLVTCDGPGRLTAFSNLAVLVS